jgi:murein DD-endopeptidase MepM/ murein hydrolase activator NlpD
LIKGFKKRRKSKLVRFIALMICVLMVVPYYGASATTVDEIKEQQAELQAQTDELQSKLDSLKDDEAKAQEYSDTLQQEISVTEQKIDAANNSITTLNSSISDLEKKLSDAENEYAGTLEKLKERIKALYMTGDIGTIQILLNSKSLYDFSLKNEALKKVTEHDNELMSEIKDYMSKTKADREELESQKNEVADMKKQLEADQTNLQGLETENESVIATLQSQQSDTQSQISANEEEDASLNAQIADLIAQEKAAEEAKAQAEASQKAADEAAAAAAAAQNNGSSSSTSGNELSSASSSSSGGTLTGNGFSPIWPLPGYGTSSITCYYGEDGHMGLDIAAPYGTPIIAAESGKVLSAEYHWSWGNNVLIYHNGTYSTRYAHMSSFAVSAGEYVTQGQVIGYVGSTGNSTGNHLHFEVYVDGYRVDPYPYIA